MLVLVRSELLEQFVNKLTADYQYFCHNRENLWQQVSGQISQKPKTFSGFFIAFLKSTLIWSILKKRSVS